ncbi:MAG: hypothetical protein LAT84_04385 [Balneolia bacterium]|nr:hypothetical protein [Balneolia bacterium]
MKEVTLKIPDKKLGFFMELINQLGFEVIDEVEIPEEHKDIVRNRILTAKPEDAVTWEEAREKLVFEEKA